jgi:nucleoside-diphosphate-sugar epimerase
MAKNRRNSGRPKYMRILCTGGAGYLGSVLVPMLLERHHEVTVIDNFQHRQPSLLAWCAHPRLTILNGDVRSDIRKPIQTADVIIPLAALVGAPLCDKDPISTMDINTHAIEQLLYWAREEQIVLFPMTNSGYGTGGENECTEESPLNPVSLYGKSKVSAERAVLHHPRSVSFRFATLFGCSPRMRLDLLVNDFVHRAVHDRALTLFEGGFRRNYLHVRDAARAFLFAIEYAESKQMYGNAFNVGLSSANLTKRELCEKIAEHIPGFIYHESTIGKDPDRRDYVVSNAKIERLGWLPQYTLDNGIRELITGFTMPLGSIYKNV